MGLMYFVPALCLLPRGFQPLGCLPSEEAGRAHLLICTVSQDILKGNCHITGCIGCTVPSTCGMRLFFILLPQATIINRVIVQHDFGKIWELFPTYADLA
eukprot:13429529-Ditylum_brightwellii.AAC.1